MCLVPQDFTPHAVPCADLTLHLLAVINRGGEHSFVLGPCMSAASESPTWGILREPPAQRSIKNSSFPGAQISWE